MATKPDRKEYFKKYDAERKRLTKEEKEKNKEAADLQKYREWKFELEETKKTNTWFDPNRNPYLNRLTHPKDEEYFAEKLKRFFLQYDMDNLWRRKPGDSKKYAKERQKAFDNFSYEKDLFHRIQYYRIFRREFKRRWNNESPDKTNRMMNNCFIPSEIHPDSSDFRPELLHLLEEGKDTDPKMKVLIPPEWAQKLIDDDSSDSDEFYPD